MIAADVLMATGGVAMDREQGIRLLALVADGFNGLDATPPQFGEGWGVIVRITLIDGGVTFTATLLVPVTEDGGCVVVDQVSSVGEVPPSINKLLRDRDWLAPPPGFDLEPHVAERLLEIADAVSEPIFEAAYHAAMAP